ncbi:diguanylate cyclase/phosphodiesterase with PAS/PAC sensor(s) [Nitrosomonas sp. Is79A3]|uniref:EAL domain-containing protein n=1 Tax=Nitrosomonas sp. (strain Is79A3) TaxID=261292 RepID=UPI000215D401
MSKKEKSKSSESINITNNSTSAEYTRHTKNTSEDTLPVVGIASSAGGVSALKSFFMHAPPKTGMAFVVIQHLESTFESKLVELLQPGTQMKVIQADNRMEINSNCIYVMPSDRDLTIKDGILYLVSRPSQHKLHLPADLFFQALAEDKGESAIGVILSGMGSDGTLGLKAIKKNNGWTFVQDPISCEFDSMPRNAIDAGYVDDVGLVEELPGMIISRLKHYQLNKPDQNGLDTSKHSSALNKILHLIYERTGHEFSQYKKSTLYRRIERRVKECKINSMAAYAQYLHENYQEVDILFKELLINVTYFFRDPDVWQYLEEEALPPLLRKHPKGTVLRAWIPACSTGEEAYSLAILFKEAINRTKLKNAVLLQIFATDLDAEALNKARKGFYPLTIAENISSARLKRFFIKNKNGYQIKDEVRELVIFAEHNITKEAPFSKLDLLSCRNLLIYLNRELQENLLPMFHYALNPEGILLLGTAETIGRYNDLFHPIDIKLPIYKRTDSSLQSVYLHFPNIKDAYLETIRNKKIFSNKNVKLSPLLDESQSDDYTPLSLLINKKGEIVYSIKNSNIHSGLNENSALENLSDVTTLESLMTELQISREELHAVHEEMQTSQEELRSGNEELRATNEDLHHANENLQLTNQELVDFKKKLLDTNERLKSTNTELVTYIKAIGELALVSVADRTGKITEANARFCEISEYSKEELIGQNHSILKSGTHSKAFFVELWKTIAGGNIWHKEICNRTKSGKLYWVDSVIVPLKDTEGRVERYISIRVDISKRKQKELQLVEQLKEKSCLYAIHRDMVLETSLQKLCSQIIKHLTLAMRFPEIAVCSIKLFQEFFTSDNYQSDLSNYISTKIKVSGNVCGRLSVFYTEDKPFILPDEQNLINFIAEDLGIWFERRNHEQHINHMASHDVLTGLPNRLLLQDRITKALEFNQRHHGMIAVLFIDLDNFKNINDTFGHNLGDLLLKKVAERLSASIRSEDTVARQGGDEFIVVLPYLIETNVVDFVAQKILNQLSEPYFVNEHEFYITCSIGIALYPEHGKEADILLKHSDTAMYHAKSAGRNSFRYFSEEMNLQAIENHRLTNYLHSAIKGNQLQLFFQPIVDVKNTIISLEILLRWQHAVEGWISPSKFIPLAEESGLILPLGEWIIKSACLQIKTWENDGFDVPRISINLSAKQFQHKSFFPNIQRILNETDVTAHHLILEITESLLMKDNDNVIKTLNQLSNLGFMIAIDDFGTGYSSLSYLKHYPINKLKIDRSFVSDITTDENDAAIVIATIGMAHSLGIEVIAEGVETAAQLAFLNERGCDLFQGFYFCKPVPASEIVNLLRTKEHSSIY